ncbi:hypothetical protein PFLUV_G00012650 [Perca fluviatilis]|uniref:Uncharacterized protein n=1 Tax=Perca fluviatilis TaxID=8168 RepID=A0A6A5FSD4_PERFL|nr:hypothetical protein PFLUV_G00012650 [Perca fluviatilis]
MDMPNKCEAIHLAESVSKHELEHMTRRDAANLENIQVNVSSSDDDIFHSNSSQNEDTGLQILRTPPEYVNIRSCQRISNKGLTLPNKEDEGKDPTVERSGLLVMGG